MKKRICCNSKCGAIVDENECMDWKHPIGERFCPNCYEVTEEYGRETNMLRAFKIVVSSVDNPGSFGVYIAKSASKAKTMVVSGLLEAGYTGATYSWITSCRRAPRYDRLADKGPGCVAWRYIENGTTEEWRIDTEYGRDELKEFEE